MVSAYWCHQLKSTGTARMFLPSQQAFQQSIEGLIGTGLGNAYAGPSAQAYLGWVLAWKANGVPLDFQEAPETSGIARVTRRYLPWPPVGIPGSP
jgi:hypothetical protein